MTAYLARRAAALVPVLLVVTVVAFGLVLLLPGDPAVAVLGESASPEQLAALRGQLGLDDPVHVRYVEWLGNAATGDLGTSLFTPYAVSEAIGTRLPATVSLIAAAMVLSVVVGVAAGAWTGYRASRGRDRFSLLLMSAGMAIPNFWLGLVLLLVFALQLDVLPATGYVAASSDPTGWALHLVLPATTLALAGAAELARQTRSSVIESLDRDYVRVLRAKGLGELAVLRHALRNALVPVTTVAGLQFSRLVGLSVIVERVFDIPGLGSLMVESVFRRDVPMIQGVVIVVTVGVLAVNLLIDVSYGWIDPRVRRA